MFLLITSKYHIGRLVLMSQFTDWGYTVVIAFAGGLGCCCGWYLADYNAAEYLNNRTTDFQEIAHHLQMSGKHCQFVEDKSGRSRMSVNSSFLCHCYSSRRSSGQDSPDLPGTGSIFTACLFFADVHDSPLQHMPVEAGSAVAGAAAQPFCAICGSLAWALTPLSWAGIQAHCLLTLCRFSTPHSPPLLCISSLSHTRQESNLK